MINILAVLKFNNIFLKLNYEQSWQNHQLLKFFSHMKDDIKTTIRRKLPTKIEDQNTASLSKIFRL